MKAAARLDGPMGQAERSEGRSGARMALVLLLRLLLILVQELLLPLK